MVVSTSFKQQINILLIYLLSVFSIIKYLPMNNYDLGYLIDAVFLCIITINFKDILNNFVLYHKIIFVLLVLIIYYMVLYITTNIEIEYSDIYALVLAYSLLITFISVDIGEKSKDMIIRVLALIIIATSVFIVYYYQGTVQLSADDLTQNFYRQKNVFSPLLTYSILFLFYKCVYENKKWFYIIGILVGFITLYLLQSRSNLAVVLIVSSLMFLYQKRNIIKIMASLVGLIFCLVPIIIYSEISESLSKYISFTLRLNTQIGGANYWDILLSGRITGLKYALDNFLPNPLFGILFNQKYIIFDSVSHWGVHSIWLRSLFYGGIFYFIIFMLMIILTYHLIKNNYKHKIVLFFAIGGLLVTLIEPIAPFGPGTSFLLFWMVIGFNLNNFADLDSQEIKQSRLKLEET